MMRPEQRKQAQSNMLKTSGSIALIVVILLGVLFLKIYGSFGHLLDTNLIMTDEIKIVDNIFEMKGACTKKGLVYKNHKYKIEGNYLFLELRFSRTQELNSDNHFVITIEDESLAGVSMVSLVGKDEDDQKLILEREE